MEKNVLNIEVIEVVLAHFNLVDNQYQQKTEVLYTFTRNKCYDYLLNVEQSNLVYIKSYNTELDAMITIITDLNGRNII